MTDWVADSIALGALVVAAGFGTWNWWYSRKQISTLQGQLKVDEGKLQELEKLPKGLADLQKSVEELTARIEASNVLKAEDLRVAKEQLERSKMGLGERAVESARADYAAATRAVRGFFQRRPK